MTIAAYELTIFVDRFQLFAYIKAQAVLVMTLGAGGDRHIRFQTAQRRRFRNIDMAGSAFRHVLLARVTKLHREAVRRVSSYRRFVRKLMTAGTVVVGRRL